MIQTSQNLNIQILFKCYIINNQNWKNQPNLNWATDSSDQFKFG